MTHSLDKESITPPPGTIPLGTPDRNTVGFCRTVLIVIRSDAVLNRLDELCGALFDDLRVQCVYTVPEPRSEFDRDISEKIRAREGILIPWREAVSRRFDLAIAASPKGPVELLHAPLLVMQHGPALVKGAAKRDTQDLLARLAAREDETVVLEPTDPGELGTTRPSVPVEAVGDPVFDSLLLHAPLRRAYRDALGVGGRRLVALSSTWGPDSLLAKDPHLIECLMSRLPANECVFALILHPYAWSAHGEWQIRTWLRRELSGGLRLIPQQSGWQGTLLAADCVIGDHGSVTHYAAACGIPTMIVPPPETVDGDVALMAQTRSVAHVLQSHGSALDFVRGCPSSAESLPMSGAKAFANVGNSVRAIRSIAYRLMGLDSATSEQPGIRVSAPKPIEAPRSSLRTRTTLLADSTVPTLSIATYPASLPRCDTEYDGTLVAYLEPEPDLALCEADAIVLSQPSELPRPQTACEEALARFPHARVALAPTSHGWTLCERGGTRYELATTLEDQATIAAAALWCRGARKRTVVVRLCGGSHRLELSDGLTAPPPASPRPLPS